MSAEVYRIWTLAISTGLWRWFMPVLIESVESLIDKSGPLAIK